MAQTTTANTFCLPSEKAEQVDEAMKRQSRSTSEFLRKAELRYIEEWNWRVLLPHGKERARENGFAPDDVVYLVDEYRADVDSIRT